MINTAYFFYDQCPLTDEDNAINRAIAARIGGGAWYGIHQTEQGMSERRDVLNSRYYADTRSGKYSVRRDSYMRMVPPAKCMA